MFCISKVFTYQVILYLPPNFHSIISGHAGKKPRSCATQAMARAEHVNQQEELEVSESHGRCSTQPGSLTGGDGVCFQYRHASKLQI